MLRWKLFRSRWLAISWLIVISILFFLPGSALPHENWLSAIHFDKWVHVGFFAMLIFLWRSAFDWKIARPGLIILLGALIYGILIEIIQGLWVSNRSSDLYDVVSDMTGSFLGLFVWFRVYKKNKPL